MGCVSSDKGTLHIFQLQEGVGGPPPARVVDEASTDASALAEDADGKVNKRSNLSFMKAVLPKYFSSEWSFAQFSLPSTCKTLCAFGNDENSFVVVTADGEFYKCTFDADRGGECKNERYDKFSQSSLNSGAAAAPEVLTET